MESVRMYRASRTGQRTWPASRGSWWRRQPPQCVTLAEPLEPRRLLSITPAEYSDIRDLYPQFALPEDITQVNLIEITPDQLTAPNLQAAIAAAASTALPDLIVVHTSDTQNTITYTSPSDQIVIDIPSSQGAISIVGYGSQPLTLDANGLCGVVSVGGDYSTTVVGLGGMVLMHGSASKGGGLYLGYGALTLTNVTISGNSASNSGAGLCLYQGTSTLTNVTISGNTAANYGGGLSQYQGASTLTNVTISGNTASASDGGGMYQVNGTSALADSTISGNCAAYGGGMYLYNGTSTLTGVTISSNTASENGGGVYQINSTVALANAMITGNSSTFSSGGGIYLELGTSTLTNVTISGNTASNGGGVYQHEGTSKLTNVTISGNTAEEGGGMDQQRGTSSLMHTTIVDNTARSGGGIRLVLGDLTLDDVTISGNTAADYGGGVYQSQGTSTLIATTISGNTAAYGGGMRLYSGSSTLMHVTIDGNSALLLNGSDGQGGGMYLSDGTSMLWNVTVTRNTASTDGGGICLEGGALTLTDTVISGNMAADGNGGGMYQSAGASALRNVTMSGNAAPSLVSTKGSGGGMYLGGGTSTMTNVTIARNRAMDWGGGVYLESGELSLLNTIVAHNVFEDVHEHNGVASAFASLIGDGSGQTTLLNGVHGNIVGTRFTPVDPQFANISGTDWTKWDLRLWPTSPAINKGRNSLVPRDVMIDLDDGLRILAGRVDMGAYEMAKREISIARISINAGAAQRSMVKQVVVVFRERVDLSEGAITVLLARRDDAALDTIVDVKNPSGDKKRYVVSFRGSGTIGGSLADGLYDVVIHGEYVTGVAGYAYGADYSRRFHRSFGDANGDRIVDAADRDQLRIALSPFGRKLRSVFDYDGDGMISDNDLREFLGVYGTWKDYA